MASQLRTRGTEYVDEWQREEEVDLHIAFAIAALLKDAWDWPNDFFVPADPFALLNPVRTSLFDDGLDAVEVMGQIERALGLPSLSEAFWESAYARSFVDVVRFLEAEMAARGAVVLG